MVPYYYPCITGMSYHKYQYLMSNEAASFLNLIKATH